MSEAAARDDEFQQFHDQRASGIGATDSPKILGLSRWGSPLTVYQEKLRLVEPEPPSLPAWLGKRMQGVIGELYTVATGQRLRAVGELTLFRSKRHPWLICHGDFRAWRKPKLWVEAKTRAYRAGWGEDGSTDVPPEEWVQAQHEMAVSDADECHIAVLFGHREFNVYPIARDEGFISELIPKLEAYWYGHVVARIPPEPIGHWADEVALRRDFDSDGAIIPATPEQEQMIRLHLMARSNRLAAAAAEEAGKQKIIKLLKDAQADGIEGSFGSVTFRKDKDRDETAWELYAGSLRKLIEDMREAPMGEGAPAIQALLRSDLDALRGMYTEHREGSRRFLINERTDA